jgi:hypothetical protein
MIYWYTTLSQTRTEPNRNAFVLQQFSKNIDVKEIVVGDGHEGEREEHESDGVSQLWCEICASCPAFGFRLSLCFSSRFAALLAL